MRALLVDDDHARSAARLLHRGLGPAASAFLALSACSTAMSPSCAWPIDPGHGHRASATSCCRARGAASRSLLQHPNWLDRDADRHADRPWRRDSGAHRRPLRSVYRLRAGSPSTRVRFPRSHVGRRSCRSHPVSRSPGRAVWWLPPNAYRSGRPRGRLPRPSPPGDARGQPPQLTSFEPARARRAFWRDARGTPSRGKSWRDGRGFPSPRAGVATIRSVDRSLDVHVSHLRHKIGDDAREARSAFGPVRGVGYVLFGLEGASRSGRCSDRRRARRPCGP